MGHPKGLNVAGNWTAVQDQLRAALPELRHDLAELSPVLLAWMERNAQRIRQDIEADLGDVDPETLRRVFVKTIAMVNELLHVIDPGMDIAAGTAQTVMAFALYGDGA